jgi:hypothetical protein
VTQRDIDGAKDALTFRTDGKPTTGTTRCCGEVTTTATWEGTALKRRSTWAKGFSEDTWTLSADGLELTIDRRASTGRLVLVMGKKP